jgi:hypothetical protein
MEEAGPMKKSNWLVAAACLVTALTMQSTAVWAADDDDDAEAEKPRAVQHYRPEACKKCHEEIYDQWKGSMHSQSTALTDPIHGAFYRQEVGSPTEEGMKHKQSGTFPICLSCHAPVAYIDKTTKLDAKPAYSNGVHCGTCHSFTAFKGTKSPDGKLRLGINAYEYDESALHGPSGIYYTTKRMPKDAQWPEPVHHPQPMKGNSGALYKSNDICMGCHDQRNNPKDVPLCSTGSEYSSGKSFVNCQACHMPRVDVVNSKGEKKTVFDHSMAGGQDRKMIQQGLALNMETSKEGDAYKTVVTLHNRLPHSFPTGAPFRNFYLKVAGYDKDGKVLWQNFEKHPMKEDPKAMFVLTLGKEGKPAMPPEATEILSDTRLRPDEVRVLEYAVPASKDLAIIRAEALYNLLLPGLIERFGEHFPDDVKGPRLAASAEHRL